MRTKFIVAGFAVTACCAAIYLSSYMPSVGSVPSVGKSSFTPDPERGLVASIPERYVTFMGHPVSIVVERGGFSGAAISRAEIEQANSVLRFLPNCIRDAEDQLRKYAGSETIAGGDDIQNPHVWLSGETDDPADWAIVVEMKDNDGYGWHIEFGAEKFKTIWAGS